MSDKVMFTRSVDIVPCRKGIYKDAVKDTSGFRLLVWPQVAKRKECNKETCDDCEERDECELFDKACGRRKKSCDKATCDGCEEQDECELFDKACGRRKKATTSKACKPQRRRKWGDDEEYDTVMRNFGTVPGKPGEEVEQQLVFGWANVTIQEDGTEPFDFQGDRIDTEILESAAYNYVLQHGMANQEHEYGTECGWLVESMMFTKEKMNALGIPEGLLPEGWFVGFYIPDPDVYKKVRDGEYNMFSIEGYAVRVPVEGVDCCTG